MCLHTRFLNVLFYKLDIDSAIRRLVSRSFCRIRVACAIKKKKASKTPREISTLLRLNRRTALSPSQTFWGWTFVSGWDAPLSGNLFVEWNEQMNEWRAGNQRRSRRTRSNIIIKHHNKSKTQCRQNLQKHKTTKKKKNCSCYRRRVGLQITIIFKSSADYSVD